MEKLDKSNDCPNGEVTLIEPLQVIPDISPIAANSTYTTELADMLCAYVAEGGNITKFVTQYDGNLTKQQVNSWFNQHDSFRLQYELATLERAKYRAETIDNVSQAVADGTLHPSAAKVISQNTQWLASKDNPKKYGEASLVKLADADGNKLSFGDMMGQITE